jgi:hypothetical protein
MVNGQWSIANGQWSMVNGQWSIWSMVNGKKLGDRRHPALGFWPWAIDH